MNFLLMGYDFVDQGSVDLTKHKDRKKQLVTVLNLLFKAWL